MTGKTLKIASIPGDGTGPAAQRIIPTASAAANRF